MSGQHEGDACGCSSCTGQRNKPQVCGTCGGTGRTPSIEGELRPCSRCDIEGFEAWLTARRQAQWAALKAAKERKGT